MKRLVTAFAALSALDIVLTLWLVGSGTSTELNPVMARMIAQPLLIVLAYKVGGPLVLGLLLAWLDRWTAVKKIVRPKVVLRLAVVMFAAVCVFNVAGLLVR